MNKSFRRFLGLGLLGVMLAMAVPTFASAPQSGKKGGKKAGKKKAAREPRKRAAAADRSKSRDRGCRRNPTALGRMKRTAGLDASVCLGD